MHAIGELHPGKPGLDLRAFQRLERIGRTRRRVTKAEAQAGKEQHRTDPFHGSFFRSGRVLISAARHPRAALRRGGAARFCRHPDLMAGRAARAVVEAQLVPDHAPRPAHAVLFLRSKAPDRLGGGQLPAVSEAHAPMHAIRELPAGEPGLDLGAVELPEGICAACRRG